MRNRSFRVPELYRYRRSGSHLRMQRISSRMSAFLFADECGRDLMINFRVFFLQQLEPGSKSVVFGFEVVVLGFESINLLDTCIPLRLHLVVFTLHLRIRPDDLGFIAVIQLIYGVGCY